MTEQATAAVSRTRRRLLGWLGLGGLAGLGLHPAAAADGGSMDHDHHGHEHHHHGATTELKRSEAVYRIPEVNLVRRDGAKVGFPAALDGNRIVLLNFIYTSCTTICPLTSQVFSDFERKLGPDRNKVLMVSISIDPEYDTPERLAGYARRFDAGEEWQYYTGSREASIAMQKAFDVYRGDKMNHTPVTFLRGAAGKPWIRLDGFASPGDLLREYQRLQTATG